VIQRKSFAYAIQQVQRLHMDSEQWNKFKQNWDCSGRLNEVTGGDGGEDDAGTDKDNNNKNIALIIEEKEDEEEKNDAKLLQGVTTTTTTTTIPSRLTGEIRRALLRLSQVQERAIVEKDKEIQNLKLMLEESNRANGVIRAHLEEKNSSLQATVVELQAKVLKHQKTIALELKTIRGIATKRASSRQTTAATTTTTTTKLAQVHTQSTEKQQQQQQQSQRQQTQNTNDLPDKSMSISSQAAPPRLPSRKASGRDGEFEITIPSTVASSDIVAVSSPVLPPLHKEDPPKLPIRQSSSPQQVKKVMSATLESPPGLQSPGDTSRTSIVRKVSFTNQYNNTPPALPQRQASSQRAGLVKQFSDISESFRTATTSLATSTDHFARSHVTMDTHTDEVKILSSSTTKTGTTNPSGDDSQQVQQHLGGGVMQHPSFVPDENDIDLAATLATRMESEHFASQEISFIPTDFEVNGGEYHPPPPSDSPHSIKGTIGNSKKTRREQITSSHEIQFDASATFLVEGGENARNPPSVSNMQFDGNHQLMLDASKAMSSSSAVIRTPFAPKNRKTAAAAGCSATVGEMKHEIDLAGTSSQQELEFDIHQVQTTTEQDQNITVIDPYDREVNDKSEEEFIQEKVFGSKVANMSQEEEEEHDEDDEYDLFGSLPSEFPVGSDRYLECNRSVNLSPVSPITPGPDPLPTGGGGGGGNDDDDDDDGNDGPKKSLNHTGFVKRLPLEENFDSDDDVVDGNDHADNHHNSSEITKLNSLQVGRIGVTKNGTTHNSSPRKKVAGGVAVEKSSGSRNSKKAIEVDNKIVHDKYGDGGLYSGYTSIETGLPHGFGKMKYENGRHYEGNWKGGRWHGYGRWINPNQDIYEGTFVYDARHGSGTYTWKNGNIYSGDFYEDKRQGKGTFNFANGNTFVGDFVNGVFEGNGRYTFGDGFYEGEWSEGRYHGQGFLLFSDGSSYRGGFVKGVAHGQGCETSADGTVRRGLWHNGRPKAQTTES
jgi:hypothetical protein